MSKETGGSAFPSAGVVMDDGRGAEYQQGAYEGMTLRDYFAAKAPVSIDDAMMSARFDAANVGMLEWRQTQEVFRHLSIMRYAYADAMLAERAK